MFCIKKILKTSLNLVVVNAKIKVLAVLKHLNEQSLVFTENSILNMHDCFCWGWSWLSPFDTENRLSPECVCVCVLWTVYLFEFLCMCVRERVCHEQYVGWDGLLGWIGSGVIDVVNSDPSLNGIYSFNI